MKGKAKAKSAGPAPPTPQDLQRFHCVHIPWFYAVNSRYFHERLRVLLYDLTLYKQNPHSIMDAPEHTSEFESHSGPFNDPINRQMVPANSSQQLPDPPGFSCGAAATFLSRLSCTQTCKGEAGATAVSWAANLFFLGVHSLDSPFESFGNYRNM